MSRSESRQTSRGVSPAVSSRLLETPGLISSGREPAAYSPQDNPSWREAMICALSYMLATLFVFTPLRNTLGDNHAKHIVPMISIWFHPVRTRGNLVEVIYYSVLLLTVCTTTCLLSGVLLKLGSLAHIHPQVVSLVLLCVLSATFGLMGMLRISTSDPSYQTASSAAILFLVAVMVGDGAVQQGTLQLASVGRHLQIILIGAGISTVVCFSVYRKTSIEALRKKAAELSLLVAGMLEILADVVGDVSQDEALWQPTYTELDLRAQKLLLEMREHAKYAPYGKRIAQFLARFRLRGNADAASADYYRVMDKVSSVQRQATHLGGMRHSVVIINRHLAACERERQTATGSSGPSIPSVPSSAASVRGGKTGGSSGSGGSGIDRQNMLIHQLNASVQRFTRDLANYVFQNKGEYYYDEPVAETPMGSSARMGDWVGTQLLATRLKEYTTVRDPILHALVDMGGDNTLHATCVLFAHVLQKLSEEILFGFSGHFEQGVDAHPHEHAATRSNWISRNNERQDQAAATLERLNAALDPSAAHPAPPSLLKRLSRKQDLRYGIRVGLGAFFLCLPAFLKPTNAWFHKWHGEWAVNIYMIVMVRNMGGMRSNFRLRLIGSTLGACVGMCVSELWETHPVMLALCSFVMSTLCFHRLLSDHYPVFGRFVLMSYNLVCLYCYAMELEHPNTKPPITDITFHRIIAVAAGVVWSVITTTIVMPHSASRSLRYNLCIQWMRMGMGWKFDPLAIKRAVSTSVKDYFRGFPVERELQSTMLGLNTQLNGCCDEIRLNSNFRREPYEQLLISTKVILDSIHSFCTLLEDDRVLSASEENLATSTDEQRHRLCQFLFLQFYISATSIRLGFPLPDYFSASEEYVQNYSQSVDSQWAIRKDSIDYERDPSSYYDFVLFYSFVTVASTAFEEVRKIHMSLHEIYGPYHAEALFD